MYVDYILKENLEKLKNEIVQDFDDRLKYDIVVSNSGKEFYKKIKPSPVKPNPNPNPLLAKYDELYGKKSTNR